MFWPIGFGVAEQLLAHGLADDAGGAAAADFAVEKLASGREQPVLRDEIVDVGAGHDA